MGGGVACLKILREPIQNSLYYDSGFCCALCMFAHLCSVLQVKVISHKICGCLEYISLHVWCPLGKLEEGGVGSTTDVCIHFYVPF